MSKGRKESKASRKEKDAKRIVEFTHRLFGPMDELNPEEVEALSDSEPSSEEMVHRIADKIATRFRLQGKVPPPQTQVALDATRPLKDFGRVSPSRLKKILDAVVVPNLGPAGQLSYSFRGKSGLTEKDKAILEQASEEVRQDWNKK